MKKIKVLGLCIIMVAAIGLMAGCTSKNDNADESSSVTDESNSNNNNENNTNSESNSGGVIDDIGNDIESGINDIGNDLDGNSTEENTSK